MAQRSGRAYMSQLVLKRRIASPRALSVGIGMLQGRRCSMEDVCEVTTFSSKTLPGAFIASVADGSHGASVAHYVAKNIGAAIEAAVSKLSNSLPCPGVSYAPLYTTPFAAANPALLAAFPSPDAHAAAAAAVDERMLRHNVVTHDSLEGAAASWAIFAPISGIAPEAGAEWAVQAGGVGDVVVIAALPSSSTPSSSSSSSSSSPSASVPAYDARLLCDLHRPPLHELDATRLAAALVEGRVESERASAACSRIFGVQELKPPLSCVPSVCPPLLIPPGGWLAVLSDGVFDCDAAPDPAELARRVGRALDDFGWDAPAAAAAVVQESLDAGSRDNCTLFVCAALPPGRVPNADPQESSVLVVRTG